jgi:hypothetical protein
MLDLFRRIYYSIGIHAAPKGTLLYGMNRFCRRVYQSICGRSLPIRSSGNEIRSDKLHIAFHISGGVGDHLIAVRYIRDLLTEDGNLYFDVYTPRQGVGNWLFSIFPQFNKCYEEFHVSEGALEHYALAIRLSSFVRVYDDSVQWNVIEKQNIKLLKICQNIVSFQETIRPLIDQHPRLDGYLGQMAVLHGSNRSTFLQYMSQIGYGGDHLPIKTDISVFDKLGIKDKNYITIHNGFDPEFRINNVTIGLTSTKLYPHFAEVISLLKAQFPHLIFVQLGVETSELLPGIDINLLEQTNFEQTSEIIRQSLLHIDAESGLVHLASCLGTKACVVFGPTSADYFAYEGNINVRPNFCGGCWWMTDDWMKKCPRGFAEPRCLSEQPAEMIVNAVLPYLRDNVKRTIAASSAKSVGAF